MAPQITAQRASRPWIVCPACEGEGRIEIGEWYVDRDTGAASPVTEECDLCGGFGGIPNEDSDGQADDLDRGLRAAEDRAWRRGNED